MGQPFYITTTLPYVNADPHIGFALEIVQADVIARYRRLAGDEVFFNTGTDEHGVKIYRKALEQGMDVKAYTDAYAAKFETLREALDLSYDAFIRTTDPKHVAAAQAFWRRCEASGDIYKKHYQVKYCVGCELEKTESELEHGHCPLHPTLELELIEEENYFFRFSRYTKALLDLYARRPDLVVPAYRFNEIKSFVAQGLEDFSISRLKEKMPWGVPVPGDEAHVMYVWFDALINYISTLGWPEDEERFAKFWGIIPSPKALQIAGKDNVRQQSAMWQAMLISAELPSSRQILIHGFITSGGQKMSKSLGNVIEPYALVEAYGTDAVRYFLMRHIHPFEDSDFTLQRFKDAYNADLANGLGNVASRIMTLAEKHLAAAVQPPSVQLPLEYADALDAYEFNKALEYVWRRIQALDQRMNTEEPFKMVKTDPVGGQRVIAELAAELAAVARLLKPFMPKTSARIEEAVLANKKPENLFPRKE